MSHSDSNSPTVERTYRQVKTHEEILERHDRRISQNENHRLQIQGALKFAAFVLGSGVLTTVLLLILGLV